MRTFYRMKSEADAYRASTLLFRAGYDAIPIKSLKKPQWYVDLQHQGDPPPGAKAVIRRVDPDVIGSAKRVE